MVFHHISAFRKQTYNLRKQTTPREMSRLWFTSPLKFGSAATVIRLMGAFCSSYSTVSAVIYPQSDLSMTLFFFSKCQWTTRGEYEIILLPLTFIQQSTIKSIELTLKDAWKVVQWNQTFLQIHMKWDENVWGNIWLVTCLVRPQVQCVSLFHNLPGFRLSKWAGSPFSIDCYAPRRQSSFLVLVPCRCHGLSLNVAWYFLWLLLLVKSVTTNIITVSFDQRCLKGWRLACSQKDIYRLCS